MRLCLCASVVGLLALVGMPSIAAAQGSGGRATTRPNYTPPKTPWGDPDLQGLWPGTFSIPVERDPKFGDRLYLTDEELRPKEQQFVNRQETDRGGSEFLTGKEVVDIDHPPYWVEYQAPNRQTSLVVDPVDGRIPALTPRAAKAAADVRKGDQTQQYDSYEDFSMWQRCISRGIVGSMMPTLYNNGNQILQAPGYVILRSEMIHEARVIPLDNRPRIGSAVSMYMGDSRGRWEGNTLVVETTNLNGRPALGPNFFNGTGATSSLRLIERFTRTAADQLVYEVTMIDPETWTRPWTIRYPYKADPEYELYEYACHEANYGLANTLAGERAEEQTGTPR